MCRLLEEHRLLEAFIMQMTPAEGNPIRLGGLYRVSEPKLLALSGDVLQHFARSEEHTSELQSH